MSQARSDSEKLVIKLKDGEQIGLPNTMKQLEQQSKMLLDLKNYEHALKNHRLQQKFSSLSLVIHMIFQQTEPSIKHILAIDTDMFDEGLKNPILRCGSYQVKTSTMSSSFSYRSHQSIDPTKINDFKLQIANTSSKSIAQPREFQVYRVYFGKIPIQQLDMTSLSKAYELYISCPDEVLLYADRSKTASQLQFIFEAVKQNKILQNNRTNTTEVLRLAQTLGLNDPLDDLLVLVRIADRIILSQSQSLSLSNTSSARSSNSVMQTALTQPPSPASSTSSSASAPERKTPPPVLQSSTSRTSRNIQSAHFPSQPKSSNTVSTSLSFLNNMSGTLREAIGTAVDFSKNVENFSKDVAKEFLSTQKVEPKKNERRVKK